MRKLTLHDGGTAFESLLLDSNPSSRVVLFAVGSGGNPERHLPLLESLAKRGNAVVAPIFDRLASPFPTSDDLLLRARRLRLALDEVATTNLPAIGVGHSIGATLLLGLAGAKLWTREGHCLPISQDSRLTKLALFSPPTGYFKAPGALDDLKLPIQAWVGSLDSVTPPTQLYDLRRDLGEGVPMDLRVIEGAGHFSFMNTLPPGIDDPLPDRNHFLEGVAEEISRFVES